MTDNIDQLEFFNTYHTKDGSPGDAENYIAKESVSNKTGIHRYFIKAHGNILYDVQNAETYYYRRHPWRPTKVSKEVYDLYIKFLTTKRKRFLIMAERGITNG